MEDFLKRVESQYLNKRLVENLIKSGAFDCFKVSRAQMVSVFEPLMEMVYADKRRRKADSSVCSTLWKTPRPQSSRCPKAI